MNWRNTPESSSIAGFGYNEEQFILVVEFKNSSTYNYYDVPLALFEQMQNAPSVGTFLAQYVKGNYRYART